MNANPRILAFAGSTRRESFNKKLVKIAAAAARQAGGEVTEIDLRDFTLPVFDEDLEREQGLPENGRKLKDLFIRADGFLISAPEYNSSVTAVFKNSIDWVSRPAAGEPPLAGFMGKTAALMSASPGALGGLRGLVHVRSILGNIGVLVMPQQIAVPNAFEAFQENGTLRNPEQQQGIEKLGGALVDLLKKLRSA
jgi:NAD(P)H-dependent FMN reductase